MKTLWILTIVIGFSSSAAMACFATPPEQIVPAVKLVERTSQIVLANVVEAKSDLETGEVMYSFRVVKTLKGNRIEVFLITGSSLFYPEDLTTFDHHRSEVFWKDNAGRCHHDTDCKIHPSFAVGDAYLVFIDAPYHRKSFERIAMLGSEPDTRDQWLAWVEETVKAQGDAASDPSPELPPDSLSPVPGHR